MNIRIIVESKLVADDDISVYILFTVLFIEWRGYKIGKNVFYQDNKSEILLEVNGRGVQVIESERWVFVTFDDRSG